jgi:hypothetical protein
MSIGSLFCHHFCDFKTFRSHQRLSSQHQNENLVSKGSGECPLIIRFQIFKRKNKFQRLSAFEMFSSIIFFISRFSGQNTGLVLNSKIKTISPRTFKGLSSIT